MEGEGLMGRGKGGLSCMGLRVGGGGGCFKDFIFFTQNYQGYIFFRFGSFLSSALGSLNS